MSHQRRFSDAEILLILRSLLSARELRSHFKCSIARIVAVRRRPPERFLASLNEREAVLTRMLPEMRTDHHRASLQWLVGRMLPGGLVHIDAVARREAIDVTDRQHWAAMHTLQRLGFIHQVSHAVYRFA